MPVFRNESNGTWYVMARYVDWQGNHKQKCKRGFKTKREALEWERVFHLQQSADMDMSFESFVDIYKNDIRSRIKETTWLTKVNIIDKKILPYFGKRKISEIQTKEVIAWQNDLLRQKDKTGKPYSKCYLKTIHNQLSAIFKTKYNELKEKCRPFLEALEHFPEVAKLFTEKVKQLFSFKEAQERAEKEAREKERQERIKARKSKRGMER